MILDIFDETSGQFQARFMVPKCWFLATEAAGVSSVVVLNTQVFFVPKPNQNITSVIRGENISLNLNK